MKIKKTIAGVLGFAIALSLVVVATSTASADSVSTIQSQIASLQAELASLGGTTMTTTTTGSYTFSTDLTIGSSGADVTALQTWLIAKGYSIPAGATGYFGAQTQAAVAAYQTAKGISPAAGYFGPITRAAVMADESSSSTTTTTTTTVPGCAVGAMYSSTSGAPCTTMSAMPAGCVAGAMFSSTTGAACTTSSTGVSTGTVTPSTQEGILTATQGPISNSVLTAGELKAPILNVKLQEQDSDIAIKRIQLDLGQNSAIYNQIFQTLYVLDPSGNVLATVPMNSTNVTQSGNDYILNITIPNYVVKAGTTVNLTIAADLYNSILPQFYQGISYPIFIPTLGIRGTDGTGTDQYSSSQVNAPTFTINQSLVNTAYANISLDGSTPQANSVPVTDTTNGQYLGLPVMVFDVNAQNDAIHIHSLTVGVTAVQNGSTGTVTAAYLYQGSTEVASASVVNGLATFSNITDGTAGATTPANTTQPYTVKVDVSGVTTGSIAITASTTAYGQAGTSNILYNSQDGTITEINGVATGNTQTVLGFGPAFSIVNATGSDTGQATNATNGTSTAVATFGVNMQAVGENVLFGTEASSSPLFSYKITDLNGGNDTAAFSIVSSGFSVPTGSTFTTNNLPANTFELPISQSGTLSGNSAFTISFKPTQTAQLGGQYAVQITALNYSNASGVAQPALTYPANQSTWRTNFFVIP